MSNPSITTWNRLEPKQRSSDYNSGLQATIHDPLWMLARQWQVGEFEGEDTASPIKVAVNASFTQLTRFASNPSSAGGQYNPGDLPLEVLVEKESINFSALDARLRAELGNEFLKLFATQLPATQNEFSVYRQKLIEYVGFHNESDLSSYSLFRKSIDANKLMTLEINQISAILGDPDRDVLAHFEDVWINWKDWAAKTIFGVERESTWDPERQEYTFSVAAPGFTGQGEANEILLHAQQYPGGHLDWPSFSMKPNESIGASVDSLPAEHELHLELIPTPVEIAGMPAQRWWEFEDGNVDLGNLETAPQDLSRMLLAHFALLSGNDWFVIPLELPVGSLTKINQLRVTNTFGEVFDINPYSVDSPANNATDLSVKNSPWRMFHITSASDTDEISNSTPFLFLPPALGPSLHSEPIEELRFIRDEMVNAAWIIERVVQDKKTGGLLDRHEKYHSQKPGFDNASENREENAALKYTLTSDVPDYWFPLLPVQDAHGKPSHKLQVGTVLREVDHSPPQLPPKLLGEISKELKESGVFNEEVPREGVFVYRQFQFARWHDGSAYLWISRRKLIGHGEGSSNLKFDSIDE